MSKLSAAAILLIACLVPVHSDDAPVVPTQGGGVVPVHEEHIRLVSETIDIYLERDSYQVEVRYVFTNEGPATTVTMGFPNESDWTYGRSIGDFAAWVGDVPQSIYTEVYQVAEKSNGFSRGPDLYYECFDTSFASGQTRIVTNTYSQEYVTNYNHNVFRAKYILSTGAYWRDSIESVNVRVHHSFRETDLTARNGYFSPEHIEGAPFTYGGMAISPSPTRKTATGFEIELLDIEPDFDIVVSFPPRVIGRVVGSSELESSQYSYAATNVLDDDPSTSWVEGVAGPGTQESVRVFLSASTAGGKLPGAYAVSSIGMINGYAQNERLYYANNRVKRVTVAYEAHVEGAFSSGSIVWNLDESMNMQWLEFDEPVLMSRVELIIDEIYPGSTYDDTCIAEIVVVPE